MAKKTPLTECPWVETGIYFEAGPPGGPVKMAIEDCPIKPEDNPNRKKKTKEAGPSYVNPAMNCLRIENNGGSAALNCMVEADLYDLKRGVALWGGTGELLDERIHVLEDYKSEKVTFLLGDIEPTNALLVPLLIGAVEGHDPYTRYLVFDRVLIPKRIIYTDITGDVVRFEVRRPFNTIIRVDAYISDKG
jgi:hypothetical protein